ncbi:uncharacterized protein LOC129980729 [Argiope bruennichi]|uniref:uncharacterized protein LOC129980729 n=1 Tax=Argiope bruennichi TaxID=94029 RepID=UPI00249419D8|nr:uncharacterized protein LOC129980729 [Argiope bruennichi]
MMKLSLSFASICRKYKFTSSLWKTKKTILCFSPNRVLFHNVNQCSVLTVSASTLYASFHCCTPLFAKQFQERENEYAHNIMSNIDSYCNSVLKYPLTLKNGPLNSSSTEISQVQELSDFSKEKEGESHSHHLIFVYGTLKRNEPNHDLVTDSSKGKAIFEAMARTVQKFPLVIASRYNIPYLLYKGVGKHVIGELYKVDDAMLERMDELECNGKYYNRIKVEVQPFIPDDENRVLPIVKPWIYFLMNYREHLLDLPHLENYSSKGPHGLEYVSRYNRPQGEDYYYEVQNVINI